MAKNLRKSSKSGPVVIAVAVPAGTVAGEVLEIGASGMIGYALTDRYLAADYGTESTKTPPQGLAEGEASVKLPGIHDTVELTLVGAAALGAPVWRTGQNTYSGTSAAGAEFIGYALEAIGAAGSGEVGLVQYSPANP